MKKRIICFTLILIMAIGLMPTLSFAATSGSCGSDLKWQLNTSSGVLTITGTGSMSSTIPWSSQRKKIKSVVIQTGATSIGASAFEDCTNLQSVTLPEGLSTIGKSAFEGCSMLESVTIPKSVKTVYSSAFYDCFSLEKVYISNMEKWCAISFDTSYSNPLGNGAELYLNDSVVTTLTIPEGISQIKQFAFYGCTSIESLSLPRNLTAIGNGAFNCCINLKSAVIPENVSTIGREAFCDCESLKSVKISHSLSSIGEAAFYGCGSLEKVDITSVLNWCKITFSDSGSNPLGNEAALYLNGQIVTDLKIPAGITKIKDYAFENCPSIVSVTIPEGVTSIGSSAFYSCSSLKSVSIASSVDTINNSAFSGCISLESVNLPQKITYIGVFAFEYCKNLKRISIPEAVFAIDTGAFSSSGIEYLYLPKSSPEIAMAVFYDTNIKYVYYSGSEADRQNISIMRDNEPLDNATWIYNANGLPNHSYDDEYDSDCNVCGEKRTALKDTSTVFKDVVSSKWYRYYVDYSVAYGIFTGTSADTFSPNDNITRAQFVQVLANLSGVDTSNRNVTTAFFDVPAKKWYTAAVKWASENKIVNGVGAGKFDPNANVTREQMCVMLVNFAKFKNITLKTIENKESFADDGKISKWAKTAVYTCQQADIVNGKGAGKFDPKGTGTRAEACVIFTKFHKNYLAK